RDGKTLASGDNEGAVKLWDIATKQELATLKGHKQATGSVAFSPDGNTLASAGGKVVKLWNITTKQEVASLKLKEHGFDSLAFSPDGNALASVRDDKMVWL